MSKHPENTLGLKKEPVRAIVQNSRHQGPSSCQLGPSSPGKWCLVTRRNH